MSKSYKKPSSRSKPPKKVSSVKNKLQTLKTKVNKEELSQSELYLEDLEEDNFEKFTRKR
tara:strand:- start:12 stop:191 length:180 start_codon:yes stop_codon:yes gene_type:complete